MVIMENAQQLVATAGTVTEAAMGGTTAASEAIANAEGALQQTKNVIDDSTSTAASLLGEGHSGTGSIVASAAAVTDKILAIGGMTQQLVANIIDLDALIVAHAAAIQTAGEQAMGRG